MGTEFDKDASTPNLEQLLQLGIQTARHGNKQSARMIFQQILDTDKMNERAWIWMAAVAETPEDRARYLRTALQINPQNPTALRELRQMEHRRESSNSQVLVYGGIALAVILLLVAVAIVVIMAAG
jgi:Tfp pilus assembly protein PilF